MTLYAGAWALIAGGQGGRLATLDRQEAITMKVMTARAILNVANTIGPIVTTPGQPAGRLGAIRHDDSMEGILVFSGIGFTLTVLAAIFQWLELPPPYF
jgi:hypothetical protein